MFLFTSKSIWHTGLIDVIGQTTKLLGHGGCYSFICNVPQKNTGSREWPYKLPSFITFFNQSVLFLGRNCIMSADVVIINHRNLWCWTCDRECHFHILFSTWNSCLISLQCYLYNLYVKCHDHKSVLFYYSCTCLLNKNGTYKTSHKVLSFQQWNFDHVHRIWK